MIETISLLTLIAVFAIATFLPINMGVLAFAAAFIVGALSGVSIDDVQSFFPGDMFILLVGITLLFGVAKANGTIELVVEASLRLVRGRRWAIVWLFFVLAAALMSIGAVLSIGMLAPLAMPIAKRYAIKPLLMAVMLGHGGMAAAFSPLTVFGAFTGSLAERNGIDLSALALFGVPFGLGVLIAVAVFLIMGRDLLTEGGRQRIETEDVKDIVASPPGGVATVVKPGADEAVTTLTPLRFLTLTAMAGLLVAVAAFQFDVGVTAFGLGAALLIIAPSRHKSAIDSVTWSAVLLVCGMLTYMAVLSENGTLDAIGGAAARIGSPLLAALLMCSAVAVLSAFGSSIGTLGIAIPLAVPLLASGNLSGAGLVLAVAFCSTVVDVSPFSSNGAMVLAQAEVPDKLAFQRTMVNYTVVVTVLAPLVAFMAIIVPTSL